MMRIATWSISQGKPVRLSTATEVLEEQLEDWIAAEPSLLDHGLRLLARQPRFDGGRLRADLVGVNAAGALVVIEIKATKIYRETVGQALDYAGKLRDMPDEELKQSLERAALDSANIEDERFDEAPREVEVVVVGIGEDLGAVRISEYLQSFDVPLRSVSFDVVRAGKELVLVREEDKTTQTNPAGIQPRKNVDEILERITSSAIRRSARGFLESVEELGIALRPYKYSVMLAPPQNRTRYLANLYINNGVPQITISANALVEFFGFDENKTERLFGKYRSSDGTVVGTDLTDDVIDEIVDGLTVLFESVREPG